MHFDLYGCVMGKASYGKSNTTGLSHPFLGMGPGPLELGKIASL